MAFSLFGTNPFVDPATGQNIFTNPTANGLLGGTNPYQALGDIGAGLLAVRPAACTAFLGSDFGKAVSYANERRDQGLLNDARRQAVLSSAQETKARHR